MPSTKAIVATVVVAAGAAAVVGAISINKRNKAPYKHEDDDDAFSTSSPMLSMKRASKKVNTPPAPASEPKAASAAENATRSIKPEVAPKAAATSVEDDLLDAVLNEIAPVAPAAPAAIAPAEDAEPTMSLSQEGRSVLPHLGLSLKAPNGWEIREELSPVPNVAMVTVWNPEFADVPHATEVPGAVPVIILSVEDVRGENLNLTEFKDRSRELALQQMAMMVGGAVQPVVKRDSSCSEGPFRHILEYSQSLPPFLDISVINLIEVRNGIAYVFQIMCSPKVMNKYKPVFMQLVRDTVVTPLSFSSLGFIDVSTGKVSVRIDTTWSWRFPDSSSSGSGSPLVIFDLNSSVKKEEISLYETEKVPEAPHKKRETKDVDGVTITSSFDGSHERKTASFGGFTFVVKPLQKAISYLSDASLVAAIKSVTPSRNQPKPLNGATFVSPEYGYRFDVVGGSRIVSTKLGNGTVVYAPLGIPSDMTKEMNPDEQGPTVTVRIGSPDNDPDCMASLEEWHERIKTEAAEGNITNIKIVPLKGLQCLSFTSKDMQEVAPGQRIEIKGDVYIFVRDGVTTLIRWETTTGRWRKFERDLNVFMESFQFS